MISENDFKLVHPSCCLLAGPTMVGKSSVCSQILCNVNRYYSKPIDKIIVVYKNDQEVYNTIRTCKTPTEFLPSIKLVDSTLAESSGNIVIWFDDQLLEIEREYCDWFTDLCIRRIHHEGISCLLTVQNLYVKCMRTIHLQASYMCLFMNHRDKSVVSRLASQVEPKNSLFLKEAYEKACRVPYGYLFLDFTVSLSNTLLRVRNTILPDDKTEIYVSK